MHLPNGNEEANSISPHSKIGQGIMVGKHGMINNLEA